jgi:hypothetical protein
VEIARLYGNNKSSIPEVMKIKEKNRASFYISPQNANVTANRLDKYLMNLGKRLKILGGKYA